ncbi:MAG: hypothetical protein M3376_08985 [Actinomycetota bacterium]|nr:hypothetical protein [Actinomycetota bacterium]
MRVRGVLCAVLVTCVGGSAAAIAQAPERPKGNFGGGALVAPPKDLFGPGNAVIALRALPEGRLEIEATVTARCASGDLQAAISMRSDGSFRAEGSESQTPAPGEKVTTTFELSGSFTSERAIEGTLSATLAKTSASAEKKTCKSGTIAFSARRPRGEIGDRRVQPRARYFGTTAQRGTGPKRPIVLRLSGDRRRISRALFGEQVKCSDGKRSIGIEAPRTNVAIDSKGRVSDHETDKIDNGATFTYIDDRFTGTLGRTGAKGTFSLSDRTVDKASGNVVQSCSSGTVKWAAAP